MELDHEYFFQVRQALKDALPACRGTPPNERCSAIQHFVERSLFSAASERGFYVHVFACRSIDQEVAVLQFNTNRLAVPSDLPDVPEGRSYLFDEFEDSGYLFQVHLT